MKHLFLVTTVLGLAGCANPARSLTGIGSAAAGSYVAHRLSNGSAGWTTAGAAGGVALSEGAWTLSHYVATNAYQDGVTKGRSDAVKELYWSQQRAQRPDQTAAPVSLYPISLPEQEIDGVIYQPSTRILRINR